jgi:cephalosporin hydroxylase
VPLKNALRRLESGCKNGLRSLLVPGAIRALRREAARLGGIEEAVALAADFSYWRIQIAPAQVSSEITGLLKLLATRPPQTLLEIGAYKGGTFFLFSRVAAPDALLINLDLPPDATGRGTLPWRAQLYRSFVREQQRIELVADDSHQPATVRRLQKMLNGRKLDFLFIDGDHSYAGVKMDYELYSPLVAKGGLIAFHDIVPAAAELGFGVAQFWKELKPMQKTTEFVEDWGQGGFGIGVVTKTAL